MKINKMIYVIVVSLMAAGCQNTDAESADLSQLVNELENTNSVKENNYAISTDLYKENDNYFFDVTVEGDAFLQTEGIKELYEDLLVVLDNNGIGSNSFKCGDGECQLNTLNYTAPDPLGDQIYSIDNYKLGTKLEDYELKRARFGDIGDYVIEDLNEDEGSHQTEDSIAVDIEEFNSSAGYANVEGTLTNKGNEALEFVKLRFNYKNENGEVIDTDWTYGVGAEGLLPGESTAFTIKTKEGNNNYRSVTITIME